MKACFFQTLNSIKQGYRAQRAFVFIKLQGEEQDSLFACKILQTKGFITKFVMTQQQKQKRSMNAFSYKKIITKIKILKNNKIYFFNTLNKEKLRLFLRNKTSSIKKRIIKVFLKYNAEGMPAMTGLIPISSPGHSVILTKKEIQRLPINGYDYFFESTIGNAWYSEILERQVGGILLFAIK